MEVYKSTSITGEFYWLMREETEMAIYTSTSNVAPQRPDHGDICPMRKSMPVAKLLPPSFSTTMAFRQSAPSSRLQPDDIELDFNVVQQEPAASPSLREAGV
jgi:hypothetical protein